MVAPRTRADEPAQSTPAARPGARKRRAAPSEAGSPPNGTNGHAAPADVAAATAVPGLDGVEAVLKPPVRSAKDSPQALGEQLIAMVVKHDPDAKVDRLRQAIEFAI